MAASLDCFASLAMTVWRQMRASLLRHCEEPLRRSNPDRLSGKTLDRSARDNPLVLPGPHITEQKSRYFADLDLLAALGDAIAAVVAVDVLERLVA